jgi:glycosyltransferase involved in cell wall biosynthesis
MKVLFATYPMAFHTPGGGEIQLQAYKKYLPQQGVEVTLFDQWNPRFLENDIVHFFSCVGGSWHFCNFVKGLGLPLVISSSLWITEESRHLYPYEEIRNQLQLADIVVANSDIECNTLARVLELPREKFATVYNGVDPIYFELVSPAIFRSHFEIEGPFVLNVGNIEPRKNQLNLVGAMKAFPDIQLILIGHARDPDYLKRCLEEGSKQVRYLGAMAHGSELLRSAFAACQVFALPSTLETPGLAALEASSIGARLVVTEVGSTMEYFGDSVEYIQPESVLSITHGIRRGIERVPCFDLMERVQKVFSWELVSHQLLNTYTNVKNTL